MTLYERLVSKIDPQSTDECWEWKGGKTGGGYGSMKVEGVMILVHQIAYTLWVGPLTVDMIVHHKCENRACINPHHLELLTSSQHKLLHPSSNPHDCKKNITHCPKGHIYDESNTYLHKGARYCRECKRASVRLSNQKHKERISV